MIYLHVGVMKSGTTFLQDLLWANRDALATRGYQFPGERWRDQDRAVRDVLRLTQGDERFARESAGMWRRLSEQMLAHRGASILSMEFLSFADPVQARHVVQSLDGADVHVVLTVRDAVGAIPSQWQTACRNGSVLSWRDYLEGVDDVILRGHRAQGHGARLFRRTQGIPRMLRAWGSAVPADRLHVVAVPPRGSDPMLLWHRVASVLGLPPDVCRTVPPLTGNPSLGHASAELMRRVNVEVRTWLTQTEYNRTLKGPLARGVLAGRAGLERPLRLDRESLGLGAQWNGRVLEAVRKSGARYVGSPDDLPARVTEEAVARAPQVPEEPTSAEILEAAAAARDGLVDLTLRRGGRLPEHADLSGRHDAARDPVAAAVADVADLALAAAHALRDREASG